jgi:hypothetical protein
MRNLKKYFAVALIVTMLATLFAPAIAAETATAPSYAELAQKLYDLGLYKGVGEGTFNPDLSNTLNRETGATMVLRLFGLEEEAKEMPLESAKASLKAKFADASAISDWAARQVAYAVEAGVVKGIEQGNGLIFSPKGLLTGQALCALIMQQLGNKDFKWATVGEEYAKVADLTDAQKVAFSNTGAIKKEILVGVAFKTLTTKMAGKETTLIDQLVKDGFVKKDAAETAGIELTPVATPAPTTAPTPAATSVTDATYGAVEVKALDTNPKMIPQQVEDHIFINFEVANKSAKDVTVTELTVAMDRFAGSNTKVRDIKIWDGATKLNSGTAAWSGDTYTSLVLLSTPLKVTANTTKALKLTADIGKNGTPAGLGEIYKFAVNDMKLSDSATATGLPIWGQPVSVSTVTSQNTVTVTDVSTTSSTVTVPSGIKSYEVAKFRVSAPSDEGVTVNSVKIVNSAATSAATSTHVDGLEVYNGTALLGSAAMDQTLTFSTPLKIEAGKYVDLTVKVNSTNDDSTTGTKFRAKINAVTDMNIVGDKFNSTLQLGSTVEGRTTVTFGNSNVSVSLGAAKSNKLLSSSKDVEIGTVFVKNDNTEEIKVTEIKVDFVFTDGLDPHGADADLTNGDDDVFGHTSDKVGILRNIRILSPEGNVLKTESTLGSTWGTEVSVNANYDDYVVMTKTFTLPAGYVVAKNISAGFKILADATFDSSDANDKINLKVKMATSATANDGYVTLTGQSSGKTVTKPASTDSDVTTPIITTQSTGTQAVGIALDSQYDLAADRYLAAGNGKILGRFKVTDNSDSLLEDADVKKIKLTNTVNVATAVNSANVTNLELYYDGKKVATASSMINSTITFGDDNGDTLFTVTDGQLLGKTLVVKGDINTDADTYKVNLVLAATTDLVAKGKQTSGDINASATVADTNDYVLTKKEVKITKLANGSNTSAGTGGVLRFTLEPVGSKSVNLANAVMDIQDLLGNIPTTKATDLMLWNESDSIYVDSASAANGSLLRLQLASNEVSTITCTAPTATGTVTVTLNGVATAVSYTHTTNYDGLNAAGEANDLAECIETAIDALAGYTATRSGAVVTITAVTQGTETDIAVTAGTTGATYTTAVTTQGWSLLDTTKTFEVRYASDSTADFPAAGAKAPIQVAVSKAGSTEFIAVTPGTDTFEITGERPVGTSVTFEN